MAASSSGIVICSERLELPEVIQAQPTASVTVNIARGGGLTPSRRCQARAVSLPGVPSARARRGDVPNGGRGAYSRGGSAPRGYALVSPTERTCRRLMPG
jgi:hypothetical protein